ncbi:MAG: glycosyltransferase [Hyphomicrobiales bacterium]|nr:glycosyltransferase [Hyphomicrobiales bacterium]
MIDTLIVVKSNHYGLTRDAELLAAAMRGAGVDVDIAGISDRPFIDRIRSVRHARRIIHIERVFPQWISAAETNLLVPNQERFPRRQIGRLRSIDLILAKTEEARIAFAKTGVPVEHLGFTSDDRFDATVPRDWNRFLHLAGGSTLKGTEDVLALWARHPEWPEMVLVQKQENAPASAAGNVRLVAGYADDAELARLQNECGIHLCPSRSEGWGHNLVEGLSCGALVLTTDAAPMNEHVRADHGVLVRPDRAERRHMGTNHFVGMQQLEAAIVDLIAMPLEEKLRRGALARQRYLEIDRDFQKKVAELLAPEPA